ncbi:MAG: anti-sigma factor [Pseudomonadota bacterium]
MRIEPEKLSAFLDGELSPRETAAIEEALAEDPALQAELERLMEADTLAQAAFQDMAEEPVPLAMAAAIKSAPVAELPANTAAAPFARIGQLLAVAVLCLGIGGGGGWFAAQNDVPPVQTAGWIADIADYHAVYSGQVRHLVEVPAEEANHIQTWLTATIGADVTIPDLSEHGLTFEGARLLVAAGKPVSQLMFSDAQGRVVALCQIANPTPQAEPKRDTLDGFALISWGGTGANFVVVGDEDRSDLDAIAQTALLQV